MDPDLWFLYKHMFRSRLFEERVKKLWTEGKISGVIELGGSLETSASFCLQGQ